MAAHEMPQWLRIVNEKRNARENAIQSFLDSRRAQFEVVSASVRTTYIRLTALGTATRRFWKYQK